MFFVKRYYKILGLPLTASKEEVKNARNNLLKKYHPDRYQGSIRFAEEKSAEINEAFEKISDFLDKQESQDAKQNVKQTSSKEEHFESAKSSTVSSEDEQLEKERAEKIRAEIRRKREEKARRLRQKREKKQERELKKQQRQEKRKNRKTLEERYEEVLEENERITRLTKDKPTIDNTLIEDERNPEKTEKTLLDFLIYGLIGMLVLLVILYFTGVLK